MTESGINNAEPETPEPVPRASASGSTSKHVGLLWIGLPIGTYAGLLALVGTDDRDSAGRPEPRQWPLPLSRSLGVRIYES